jgi:hypothetical protein
LRFVLLPQAVQVCRIVETLDHRQVSEYRLRVGRQVGFLDSGGELRRLVGVQRERNVLGHIAGTVHRLMIVDKIAKLLAGELRFRRSGDRANHVRADLVAQHIGSRQLLVVTASVEPGKE